MLLTITTTHRPATDLGYLLHKHPERLQSFDLSFGKAHVFYPEAGVERCSASLLLDVDPVGLVRGKNPDQGFLLSQYVNDRPYAASSFLSVAISQVFGSALQGRCKDRPDLPTTPIPLTARLDVLPVRGGERFLRAVFEPLGYEVEAAGYPLDERFPEWGESPYYSVTVRKTTTLAELLTHLYVLVPVFDSRKHYFVGEDELEKLLAKGEGWLAGHPEKDEIARRYLRFQPSLYRMALARLVQEEEPAEADEDGQRPQEQAEAALERPLSLNDQRLGAVVAALRASGAQADPGIAQGPAIRGDCGRGRVDPVAGGSPAAAQVGPAADDASEPGQAAAWFTHVSRQAAGRLRRRCRCGSRRASGPAPAGGLRAGGVRVRPATDGSADDTEPGIQRDVGDAPRREFPSSRPSFRVDSSRVSELGGGGSRAVRLWRAVPPGRAGGCGAGAADAVGSVPA